jgi:hypothetical protein
MFALALTLLGVRRCRAKFCLVVARQEDMRTAEAQIAEMEVEFISVSCPSATVSPAIKLHPSPLHLSCSASSLRFVRDFSTHCTCLLCRTGIGVQATWTQPKLTCYSASMALSIT